MATKKKPSAKQLAARAKFAAMARARAKAAKGKKTSTKLGASKKSVKKSPASTSRHTDTKSHNVRINVLSGPNIKRVFGIGKVNDNKLLTEIARESKLKKDVISILKRKVADYDGSYQSLFNDILQHGLQSGIIGELVYYSDTLAWYKKHKTEIGKMLRDLMSEYGATSPKEIFGKNWDDDDYFAEDTSNQNLLAWFSFEETTREIANRLGYED